MSSIDGGELMFRRPEAGEILARKIHEDDHPKPWRVISITDREHSDHPGVTFWVMRMRPMHLDSDPDPVKAASEDVHWGIARRSKWVRLPEHYPVCHQCFELCPCSHTVTEKRVEEQVTRMRRYDVPGVCPACRNPVSERQSSRTFDINLVVPGGPPVTFHLRSSCAQGEDGALRYEQAVNRDVSRDWREERP